MLSVEAARTALHDALIQTAPDIERATLADTTNVRDDLELDSIDFLNLVEAIHNATGIDIPEREFGRLRVLSDFVEYLTDAGTET